MADFKADVITKQINSLIEQQLGALEKDVIIRFVKTIYDDLLASSPIITGYYRSNHRIIIRDAGGRLKTGGTPKLEPTSKPEDAEPLSLDFSAETRTEEFEKLDKVEIGDIIRITTRVPYADDVERKHGVYAGAQALVGA